jgi:uncharacterized protein (DUF697 family)
MATAEMETKVEATITPTTPCAQQDCADEIIRKHVYGAMGAGLIPMPLVDLAALAGIQANMLRRLAKNYGVPFRKEIAKASIGTLTASVAPLALAGPVGSFLKVIPLIGMTTSAISMSITGGASTYALGKVFTQHFASGGTFLDFNPAAVRDFFAEQFKEGKAVAQAARK